MKRKERIKRRIHNVAWCILFVICLTFAIIPKFIVRILQYNFISTDVIGYILLATAVTQFMYLSKRGEW